MWASQLPSIHCVCGGGKFIVSYSLLGFINYENIIKLYFLKWKRKTWNYASRSKPNAGIQVVQGLKHRWLWARVARRRSIDERWRRVGCKTELERRERGSFWWFCTCKERNRFQAGPAHWEHCSEIRLLRRRLGRGRRWRSCYFLAWAVEKHSISQCLRTCRSLANLA